MGRWSRRFRAVRETPSVPAAQVASALATAGRASNTPTAHKVAAKTLMSSPSGKRARSTLPSHVEQDIQ